MLTYKDKLNTVQIECKYKLSISDLKDVLYTINNYDFNAAYIDDLKRYKAAIEINKAIANKLYELYDIVSVKYFDTCILELNNA